MNWIIHWGAPTHKLQQACSEILCVETTVAWLAVEVSPHITIVVSPLCHYHAQLTQDTIRGTEQFYNPYVAEYMGKESNEA